MLFICVRLIRLDLHDCHTMTLNPDKLVCFFVCLFIFDIIVTVEDISAIYVTTPRCAGDLKKVDLLSGSHAIDIW